MKRSLFKYTSVCLKPEEQIGLHSHSEWELSYVIQGSGVRQIGDHSEPFRCNELILIPSDIPHCWSFDGSDTHGQCRISNISLFFKKELLKRLSRFPEWKEPMSNLLLHTDAIKLSEEGCRKIFPLLKQMEQMEEADKLWCFIKVMLLVAGDSEGTIVGKFRKQRKEHKCKEKIKIYISCNSHKNIRLDMLADHVGMSRSAFCAFFKKHFGKTFVSYLNECRLENACNLLREEECNVSEICYKVGFNDLPYFIRLFKRSTGMTPTEYLRHYRHSTR